MTLFGHVLHDAWLLWVYVPLVPFTVWSGWTYVHLALHPAEPERTVLTIVALLDPSEQIACSPIIAASVQTHV